MRDREKTIQFVVCVGMIGNLALSALKFLVGTLCASQTLIADAVHSLSDLITDIAVLIGLRCWSAPPDAGHPYGHARIESGVAILIGLRLGGAGIAIGWDALFRIWENDVRKPEAAAFPVALASVVVKEILYRWTARTAKKVDSSVLLANAWHHRSDALSSIPASFVIGISLFIPGFAAVDRIGALLVSVFIVLSAWKILRRPLSELMDEAPPEMSECIREIASSVPGAVSVHAVRTRSSGSRFFVDLHLLVPPEMTVRQGHRISVEICRRLLASPLRVRDVVVHIEPSDDDSDEKEHDNTLQS